MTNKPGSHQHAADRAARGAVEAGLSPLEAKIVVHVAARGLDWQNDAELAAELERPDGRRYHRESIGRARRQITREGYIESRRLLPGQALPPRAKFKRTSHGTTLKHVIWSRFRLQVPTPRGQRTRERQRIRREEQRAQAPMTPAEILAAADAARRRIDGS
ncbi:MAG TPA: hypothetical protein VL131_05875 [Gammaproteobacteria bacterium]|nr:hypothetical protein [Gammaproteobacteria bacterium]